jgi:hypothetical protein
VELFNMTTDRFQTTNLARQQPDVVGLCQNLLAQWLKEQSHKPGWIGDPLQDVLAERAVAR